MVRGSFKEVYGNWFVLWYCFRFLLIFVEKLNFMLLNVGKVVFVYWERWIRVINIIYKGLVFLVEISGIFLLSSFIYG